MAPPYDADMEDAEEEPSGPRELTDAAHVAFARWFRTLPQESNTVRFFDRKGFYTCHGEDAQLVARLVYRTTGVVREGGGAGADRLSYVNLNRAIFEASLRELLLGGASGQGGHAVQLYEQAGGSGTWKMIKSASPGKVQAFEEELYRSSDMADVPLVATLTFMTLDGQLTAGIAFVDSAGARLGACEVVVGDERTCGLAGVEAVLVQLGAKEVVTNKDAIAAQDASLAGRVSTLVEALGALPTARPAKLFDQKHLRDDLAKVLRGGAVEQHSDVLERRAACSALAAVLAYAEVMADPAATTGSAGSAGGRYSLELYNPGCYMRLDATAQRALNVFPQRSDASPTFSLFGLLGRQRTAGGKRRLKAWLKQPLVDVAAIRARHDVVEALLGDATLRSTLRDNHLRGLPDIERLVRKLAAKRTSLQELHQLYRASARLPLMDAALRAHEGPHAASIVQRFAEPLAAAHTDQALGQFEALLEAALDADHVPDEYLIAASYNEQLGVLQERKQQLEADVQRIAQAVASDLGLVMDKSIKLEYHKPPGGAAARTRCLRITQKEEKNVRAKLAAKCQVIETRKDGVKFTNKALREAAEALAATMRQYQSLQADLVTELVDVASSFVEVWEGVAGVLAELDALAGLAEAAACAPVQYVRPEMVAAGEAEINLQGCRHPNVEVQDGVDFIANDCELVRGRSWLHIITGPNMGGKSTYIRSVGAAVLMAQIGSFVPCTAARVAVRDSIFCRVGAGDCQQRGVSTFMAEMLETAAILRGASSSSLVIIDELGRGTSTYDGFGLAWAIAEHIANVLAAPCLFATHFHELTELTASTGVRNAQAAAMLDPATQRLTMLYEIRAGACDQSFGVHVAASAGFPQDVITLANERLAALEAGEGQLRAAPAAKRQRTDPRAQAAAEAFVRAFAALPLDAMQADQALSAVSALLHAQSA